MPADADSKHEARVEEILRGWLSRATVTGPLGPTRPTPRRDGAAPAPH